MLGSLLSVHVKEGFGLSTVQVNECKLLEHSATISGKQDTLLRENRPWFSSVKQDVKVVLHARVSPYYVHPTRSRAGQNEVDTFKLFLPQACLAEFVAHLAHEHLAPQRVSTV